MNFKNNKLIKKNKCALKGDGNYLCNFYDKKDKKEKLALFEKDKIPSNMKIDKNIVILGKNDCFRFKNGLFYCNTFDENNENKEDNYKLFKEEKDIPSNFRLVKNQ